MRLVWPPGAAKRRVFGARRAQAWYADFSARCLSKQEHRSRRLTVELRAFFCARRTPSAFIFIRRTPADLWRIWARLVWHPLASWGGGGAFAASFSRYPLGIVQYRTLAPAAAPSPTRLRYKGSGNRCVGHRNGAGAGSQGGRQTTIAAASSPRGALAASRREAGEERLLAHQAIKSDSLLLHYLTCVCLIG